MPDKYPAVGTIIYRWLADRRTLKARCVRLRFEDCGGYVAIRQQDRAWYAHYFEQQWMAEAQVVVWREQVQIHHMYEECGCKPVLRLLDDDRE